jgi:beta-glucosidase
MARRVRAGRSGPGTEVTACIRVPARSLAHWDTAAGAWAIEPGQYQLAIGRSSRDLRLTAEVTIGPYGR